MMRYKGYIYKIYAKDDNIYNKNWCYIGQTRELNPLTRWLTHKRTAEKWERNQNAQGKLAKLHQAMQLIRPENMVYEIVEEHEYLIENELINKLNKRENYYIDHYDSKNKGGNKVSAPHSVVPIDNSGGIENKYKLNGVEYQWKTISDIARNHSAINYNTLRQRMNHHGEDVVAAVKHCLAINPQDLYEYGRQIYTVKELSDSNVHNPNKLRRKTIENRLRQWRENNPTDYVLNKEGSKVWRLPARLLGAVDELMVHTITLSDGKTFSGNIAELYKKVDKLKEGLPELQEYLRIKTKYKRIETVNSQLAKKDHNGEPVWTAEEALCLKVPPNYREVDLLTDKGYQYKPHKPIEDLNRDPVVVHKSKTIYLSSSHLAEEYQINTTAHLDYIHRKLQAGWTGDKILQGRGLTP